MAAWRILRENELRASISRPRTAQGSLGTGRMSPAPGSLSDLRNSDYRGLGVGPIARPGTASPAPGAFASDHSLRSFRSEANLKVTLGARNLSSSSLALPPPRRFDSPTAVAAGDRPSTANSMRGGSMLYADRPAPVLHLNLPSSETTLLGGPPRSPLGQFELESPVKSEDSESLLGDEPDRIADGIKARLAREDEEAARARAAAHEKRWAQAAAQAAAQRQKGEKMNAAAVAPTRLAAYPSPPSSIEGEHDVPTLAVPIPRSGPRSPVAPSRQDARPAGRGNGSNLARPAVHIPASRAQTSPVDGDGSPSSVGMRSSPVVEGPASLPKPPAQTSSTSDGPEARRGEQSKSDKGSTSGAQLLKPEDTREPTRSATAAPTPAISSKTAAPRSPLFQQISPFDVHSEEEDGDDNDDAAAHLPTVDPRAAKNTPYGLPSPPLSHRTRPSNEDENENKDENEGLPVLRTVEAKRDTMVVGGPGRESLGLQIEEFEKSLQQAQAMSALEQGLASDANNTTTNTGGVVVDVDPRIATRSRANSNASSNYSDMSESPMTVEPPLVSPKPFPLSPRPMSPGGRLRAGAAEAAAPPPRPALPVLEVRPDSPFGSVRQRTAAIQGMRRKGSEDRLPLRPRVGATMLPSRPTLGGEYSGIKVGTVASLAGRAVRRPSPDEYGIRIRPVDTPVRTASPFRMDDAPYGMVESPILKNPSPRPLAASPSSSSEVRSEYCDYTDNSAATSRANSPISSGGTGSGSYSVFSPPQPAPARRHLPPVRSVQAEWQFGPAPTAPPSSPLPIPERSVARRKNTLELAAQRRHEQQQQHGPLSPRAALAPPPLSPGLASSASIVPDPDANPNWPLPGPSGASPFPSAADADSEASSENNSGGGFAARRSLFRAGRAPPAPLNIAAARYADEISSFGGTGGPWTPDPAAAVVVAVIPASGESGGRSGGADFDFLSGGEQKQQKQHDSALLLDVEEEEDKSSAIGVARGLSIKYDRVRDGEKRRAARGQERTRFRVGASAWKLLEEEDDEMDEEEEEEGRTRAKGVTSPVLHVSPTTTRAGEPFDRLRRPNHGLKSPTGIADEQGIRFI